MTASRATAVVIGAGIIGAACARSLALDGWDVTVLERGAAAGATSAHCEGNILVSDKGPGAELSLALLARQHWRQTSAELADELGPGFPGLEYEEKGGIVVALTPARATNLLAFAESQRQAGVTAEVLDHATMLEAEPELNPSCVTAVHYPQDAQLQPTVAVEALLASARNAGARVLTRTEVTASVTGPGGRTAGVLTEAGSFPADVVVNAAGPWAGELSGRLGAPLPVLPRRGSVLVTARMPHRVFHKVYDGDYVGTTQSADAGLQTSPVIESTAAGTVLIGSSRQRTGFDDRFQVTELAEIARKAVTVFPFLAAMSLLRCYSGFRPYLPDHLPVIGEDPRLPGLWHVTGHEGAGIGLSVVSAALLRDLLAGNTPAVDPAPFDPQRPTLQPHLAAMAS